MRRHRGAFARVASRIDARSTTTTTKTKKKTRARLARVFGRVASSPSSPSPLASSSPGTRFRVSTRRGRPAMGTPSRPYVKV